MACGTEGGREGAGRGEESVKNRKVKSDSKDRTDQCRIREDKTGQRNA